MEKEVGNWTCEGGRKGTRNNGGKKRKNERERKEKKAKRNSDCKKELEIERSEGRLKEWFK